MSALPTGTVTFVFADIEGSATRWERQPVVSRWVARLRVHDVQGQAVLRWPARPRTVVQAERRLTLIPMQPRPHHVLAQPADAPAPASAVARPSVVQFTPPGNSATVPRWHPANSRADATAPIPTSLVEYDHLRSGVPVRVRNSPLLPSLARFADQSLPRVVLGPLWEALRASGILPGLILLGWFLLATRKIALLCVHVAMLQLLPLSLLGAADRFPIPTGRTARTTATLQEVRVVRSVGHTR
ncbi:MAG: hypothetical protein IT305_10440 [Chloroflexi bacterium]|nr:hypothetical protein [Chloroflexota bacterium]